MEGVKSNIARYKAVNTPPEHLLYAPIESTLFMWTLSYGKLKINGECPAHQAEIGLGLDRPKVASTASI